VCEMVRQRETVSFLVFIGALRANPDVKGSHTRLLSLTATSLDANPEFRRRGGGGQ
jgi:hypothetical protein